jgi:hypothetical protein
MNWLLEFLFPRRLHRLAYFLRLVAANIAVGYFYFAGTTTNSGYWFIAIAAIWIYAIFFVILPRMRDIEMSKWWLVVTPIPLLSDIFGIILLFRAQPILRSLTPATENGSHS